MNSEPPACMSSGFQCNGKQWINLEWPNWWPDGYARCKGESFICPVLKHLWLGSNLNQAIQALIADQEIKVTTKAAKINRSRMHSCNLTFELLKNQVIKSFGREWSNTLFPIENFDPGQKSWSWSQLLQQAMCKHWWAHLQGVVPYMSPVKVLWLGSRLLISEKCPSLSPSLTLLSPSLWKCPSLRDLEGGPVLGARQNTPPNSHYFW